VYGVIDTQLSYLRAIGAVGPQRDDDVDSDPGNFPPT
jgi:hypothetical protein